MDFDAALAALASFDGLPVAVDGEITRPADPEAKPAYLRWSEAGVLMRKERTRPTGRAVDEAAWWFSPRDRRTFELSPGGSVVLMWRNKFVSAAWQGQSLVLNVAAFRYRIVRLARPEEGQLCSE